MTFAWIDKCSRRESWLYLLKSRWDAHNCQQWTAYLYVSWNFLALRRKMASRLLNLIPEWLISIASVPSEASGRDHPFALGWPYFCSRRLNLFLTDYRIVRWGWDIRQRWTAQVSQILLWSFLLVTERVSRQTHIGLQKVLGFKIWKWGYWLWHELHLHHPRCVAEYCFFFFLFRQAFYCAQFS